MVLFLDPKQHKSLCWVVVMHSVLMEGSGRSCGRQCKAVHRHAVKIIVLDVIITEVGLQWHLLSLQKQSIT